MRNPYSFALAASAVLTLTGCATYKSVPLEPLGILEGLDALKWKSSTTDAGAGPSEDDQVEALGPRQLAAFALRTNPTLKAIRAELGVQRALLVEAGLLPDPGLGWDAMDVLASQIVDGDSSKIDALSGLSLMFPLYRPGERDARLGGAEWRAEAARRLITTAEWNLTRDIHLAFEEARAADLLLIQTQAVTELAESTYAYFKRAKEAGAATAIQANLALGELQKIRLATIGAESRSEQARQALNALLGLPPAVDLLLRREGSTAELEALAADRSALTAHAVRFRPDLSALFAEYEAAQQDVRLAVSKQYPLLSIGTGISLSLPIFSRFGRPAIKTAIARRSRLEQEFTAAVHAVRREIAALYLDWQYAMREFDLVESELLPNAEQNLELSREAFRQGEVTLLETLALQRALVEARTRYAETKGEQSKRAWALLAASGFLLDSEPTHSTNEAEVSR